MKLESLNNEKFKLNTKEMGKLVGGEAFWVCSAAGSVTIGDNTFSYSADSTKYASQRDYNAGINSGEEYFQGQGDEASRDKKRPCAS